MKDIPELIVMLTHRDLTVDNAYEIFDECKNTKAQYWGFKEESLSFAQMKKLYAYMKKCGKTTALEVVSYTEEKCLQGARMAVDCGCDILMGTLFYDSVNDLCKANHLKYMPYVGDVSGRPSILRGSIDEMIVCANNYMKKNVYGFNLLGYRYVDNTSELLKRFVSEVKAPVCMAGGVNSFQKLDEIKRVVPWAFTIGSSFFENTFNGTFGDQINSVYEYMREK